MHPTPTTPATAARDLRDLLAFVHQPHPGSVADCRDPVCVHFRTAAEKFERAAR